MCRSDENPGGRQEPAEFSVEEPGSRPSVAASAVVHGCEVFLPLEGLIDVDAERDRLTREATKLLDDLENARKKLRNQDFLTKAKPEVVDREKTRLTQLEETLDKLKRAQAALSEV